MDSRSVGACADGGEGGAAVDLLHTAGDVNVCHLNSAFVQPNQPVQHFDRSLHTVGSQLRHACEWAGTCAGTCGILRAGCPTGSSWG